MTTTRRKSKAPDRLERAMNFKSSRHAERTQSALIKVVLTPDEHAQVIAGVQRSGMPLSVLTRLLLLHWSGGKISMAV